VKGVQRVDVRFITGRIIVEHDPAEAGTDVLVDAVGRAGYTAKASAF
jgi:copper chaperone CopZ